VRFLAQRRPPDRRIIDLSKSENILIKPQEYYTISDAEDRLFIPPEYVSLFVEFGWNGKRDFKQPVETALYSRKTIAIEVSMPEKEFETKSTKPLSKVIPITSRPPTMEQLYSMKTDELVKLLLSPELAKPMNASLRQIIIKILQQREGNAFVQRLMGKGAGGK
jgi:hypothetical protein